MVNDDILKSYRVTKSMKKTGMALNISEATVKKVLITAGLYTNPNIERIKELSALGTPPKDIAEILGVTLNAVNSNMPYRRGTYLDDNKSVNALNIKRCREKRKQST